MGYRRTCFGNEKVHLLPFTMAASSALIQVACRAGADLGPQEKLYAFEDLCVLWLSTVLSDPIPLWSSGRT